jgi:hypothetical protein
MMERKKFLPQEIFIPLEYSWEEKTQAKEFYCNGIQRDMLSFNLIYH